MTGLTDGTTGLALGTGMQFQTAIGWSGLVINLTPPVLTWTSDTTTALPTFGIDFDEDHTVVGAVITVQIATDAAFTSINQTITNTLDSGEIAAGAVSDTGTPLTSGTYYARAKITGSGWSNTETKTLTISASAGQPIGLLLTLTKAA